MMSKVPDVLNKPEIDILNPKQVEYPGSRLLGKYDPETKYGIMVVLDKETGEIREVITVFRKDGRQFLRDLAKQKSQ